MSRGLETQPAAACAASAAHAPSTKTKRILQGSNQVLGDTFASQPAPVPRENGVEVGFPLVD